MMTTPDTNMKHPHLGRNVKRLREMLGIKQEALAYKLGDGWTQKKISQLEASESIEAELMNQVAEALGLPAEAIKNFSDEAAINFISNTFNDNSVNQGANYQPMYNINPVEKWVEAVEENKKLYAALLKEKDEKIALMERLLEGKGMARRSGE